MDRLPEPYKKGGFGMKFMKFSLILINALYLIISLLMISGATTLKVIFGEYYYVLWYASTLDSLSSLWIATGCFLLVLSIFGIAAAIKESTAMTNFYGLFLSLVFILQIAAAITGFTLITQTDSIVSGSLRDMMDRASWYYHEGSSTMDWIQQTFECCGNDAPSDWERYGIYRTTVTTEPWSYPTEPYYDWYSTGETSTTTTTTTTTTAAPYYGPRTPQSCCTPLSNYDSNSFTCQTYFTRGCHAPLYAILSQSVMIWGSSALVISIAQILGVVCAFTFARTIRRNKTNRDVQRWAAHESLNRSTAYVDQLPYVDRPTYVTQLPNAEPYI